MSVLVMAEGIAGGLRKPKRKAGGAGLAKMVAKCGSDRR